jgi:hypothetical protein
MTLKQHLLPKAWPRRERFFIALSISIAMIAPYSHAESGDDAQTQQTNAILRAKWNAMRAALIRGDIEGAVQHFTPPQQGRYRALFTALSADITQIAQGMREIELIYVREGRAKYRLPRTQMYGGKLVTLTYYVYFVQDANGSWSIEEF